MRTPLARLRLAVEMLPESDSLKAGMVEDIEDMDGIIRQFLDFIRGIEGERAEPGDLNALVTSVAERYQRSGQAIVTHLEDMPMVTLRPQAMHRLLTNLIDNALKYGHGTVEIRTAIVDNDLRLSILDAGPGIPESEIPRLLRPFERLDASRGASSGSGLGLAIADRIAKLHGGMLELINRPEGGLEVRISLPRNGAGID